MFKDNRFQFNILPPENGWIKGNVSLGGDNIEFSMSDVLGDDLTAFICAIWSHIPNIEKQEAKYQWRFEDDRLPCDTIVIDEEGSKVTWTIAEVEQAKEKTLHIEILADRNLYQKQLAADVEFSDFANEVGITIDSMIKACGLTSYNQNWSRPFPLTEFLIIKSVLMQVPLKGYMNELSLLQIPFRALRIARPVKKISIDSNALCYGPMPEPDDIIRQRITITTLGKIYISQYTFSGVRVDRKVLAIDEYDAEEMVYDLVEYFEEKDTDFYVTDVGSWDLTITSANDKEYKFDGSLYYAPGDWLQEFSKNLRKYLKRWDLFVFDGNTKPAADGIMFCSCEFEGGGKSYYYISDDPSLEEGDLVRVPVGDNGRTSVVEIVDIEYFKEDKVPMPLDRVKKIIERVDDWEDED